MTAVLEPPPRTGRGTLGRGDLIRLVPVAGLAAVWIVLMPSAGGFDPHDWLPAGVALLALALLAALGAGRVLPESRPAQVALLAFAAFTAWNLLSLPGAPAPADAWAASNMLLTVLASAWIVALTPWSTRTADLFLAAFSIGAAAACAVTLLQALGAHDLTSRFLDGRWQEPVVYPNAAAAFGFMAAIPALRAAARPDPSVLVKTLWHGLATFLAVYALLPQSRGSILGTTAAVVVLLALGPDRWRVAIHALAIAAVAALAAPAIFDLYAAAISPSGDVSPALHTAAGTIGLATVAGLAIGLMLAAGERQVRLGERGVRRARLAGLAAAALVVAGLVAVAAAHAPGIRSTLSDEWHSLRHPGVRFAGGSVKDNHANRLLDADPLERYDYWRVSADEFVRDPLAGAGAGQFRHEYVVARRYPKLSKYPHDLVMRVLGENGLIGALLLLACAAALVVGVVRRRRAVSPANRAIAAGGLAAAAYFVAHGSFDWLEAFPVLAWPAFALPLLGVGLTARAAPASARSGGRRAIVAGRVVAGVAVAAAAVSLLMPWIALRYQSRATREARTDRPAALADFRRAQDWNPLDPQPAILAGVLELTTGRTAAARVSFQRALEREDSYLPHLGLSLVHRVEGDRPAALRELAVTLRLDPFDSVMPAVAREIRAAGRVDPARVLRTALTSPLVNQEKLR